MPTNYLDIGSRLVAVHGLLSIAFGIIVPIMAHIQFPTPFLFVREDESYTGVTWNSILTRGELGIWITYLADTGRGMMVGLGILTIALASRPLRTGEKWAIFSVLFSGLAAGIAQWTITAFYFARGLYMGSSGVSLGIWLLLLLYIPWAVGLVLVARGRRQST